MSDDRFKHVTNIEIDMYIEKYVVKSPSDSYIIFSYSDDEDVERRVIVVDRGELSFCRDRMVDIFKIAPVKNGLIMMSEEQFSEEFH